MQTTMLYFDLMSQPSRACILYARLNQLPVTEVSTHIHKGATRSAEYRAKNPLGKVPFLEAGSLRLPESGAILIYLAQTFPDSGEAWLPHSPTEAAPIMSALNWFHGSIRAGCIQLIMNTGAIPLGQEMDLPAAGRGMTLLKQSLGALESYWLGSSPFLAGRTMPSIADLLFCCELEQLVLLNKVRHGADMEEILQDFPKTRSWMLATASATAPHYHDVHAIVRKVASLKGGSRSPTMVLINSMPKL